MSAKTTKVGVTSIRFWIALTLTCVAMVAVGFAFNKASASQSSPCYSYEQCKPKSLDGSHYDGPPERGPSSPPPSGDDVACLAVGGVSAAGAAGWTYLTGGTGGPAAAGAWSGITSATGCYTGQLIAN